MDHSHSQIGIYYKWNNLNSNHPSKQHRQFLHPTSSSISATVQDVVSEITYSFTCFTNFESTEAQAESRMEDEQLSSSSSVECSFYLPKLDTNYNNNLGNSGVNVAVAGFTIEIVEDKKKVG